MHSVKVWPTAHDEIMRSLSVAAATVLLVLCLGCGQDQNLTPTPMPLRVTLGGNPEDTWHSLRREIRKLEAEGRELNARLKAAGHYTALYVEDREEWHTMLSKLSSSDRLKAPQIKKNFAKLWPWPIQTQVAKLDKEFERIEAKLLLMDTPTPVPTKSECERAIEERRPIPMPPTEVWDDWLTRTPTPLPLGTIPTPQPTFTQGQYAEYIESGGGSPYLTHCKTYLDEWQRGE